MFLNREAINKDFNWEEASFIVVEYRGDIAGALSNYPNVIVINIDRSRVVLGIVGDVNTVLKDISKLIIQVTVNALYTACEISPVTASNADLFHTSPYLQLDGRGTVIGILDSGIDYLNEEFINADGTTRIVSIMDQPTGIEYTEEAINKAILEKRAGRDPYAIVPSQDLIGHGTNMAGIVGARGANPNIIGVAPRCKFAIVRLVQSNKRLKDEFAVYGDIPVYSTVAIVLGIKYLSDLASKLQIPMVMLIPLGANLGPRDGLSSTERYLDDISNSRGISCVVPTGNEGDGENHAYGKIAIGGESSDIELKIDGNQRNIRFEIWVQKPDRFYLSIISPTGEVVPRVPPISNEIAEISFLYEGTKMSIQYLLPERQTGDERIIIRATNITEGIWIFRLVGEIVVSGRYDAYLLQRDLLAPETKFLRPDPYTTLTTPSSSNFVITVAAYNQNNNSILRESGRGYTRDGRVKPDIAAGGVNVTTTGLGGGTQIISGTSVAAAVVAGCCSLIYQWGIVEGNDKTLLVSKMKTYLIRGANQREGDVYPNRELGYGTVDMKGVFDNIRSLKDDSLEYYVGKLFIRKPDIEHKY